MLEFYLVLLYFEFSLWNGCLLYLLTHNKHPLPHANALTGDTCEIRTHVENSQWISNLDGRHRKTGITTTCNNTTPRQRLQRVSSMVQQHVQSVIVTLPIHPAPAQDREVTYSVLLARQDPTPVGGTQSCQPKFCSNIPLMGINVFTAFSASSVHALLSGVVHGGKQHASSQGLAKSTTSCSTKPASLSASPRKNLGQPWP